MEEAYFPNAKTYTLGFLLNYLTSWSKFLQKVSIKRPVISQKKLIVLFYLLYLLIVSIKRPVLSFFSNRRNPERPDLIIETLQYYILKGKFRSCKMDTNRVHNPFVSLDGVELKSP